MKFEYSDFVQFVQGITQMQLDSITLPIHIKASVCSTVKDGQNYLGVCLKNTDCTDTIELDLRYYLEEMYKRYMKDELSIADIAEQMITDYLLKMNEALED